MANVVKKIRTNAGDLPIDYTALANLPADPINPNLLINGDFQVWQRGDSFTNVTNKYCADRWEIGNAKSIPTNTVKKSVGVPDDEMMKQSIYLKETSDSNTYLRYHFEAPIAGVYTLSFWYKSDMTITSYAKDGVSFVKLMEVPKSDGLWKRAVVYFSATSVSCIDVIHAMRQGECFITGVKLEAGMKATPFVPRPYGEELVLCQRYYEKRSVLFFPIGDSTSTTYYIAVNGGQHFVPKRISPTVTFGTITDNSGTTVNVSITSNTCSAEGLKAISLASACGKPALSSKIEFDAEIHTTD